MADTKLASLYRVTLTNALTTLYGTTRRLDINTEYVSGVYYMLVRVTINHYDVLEPFTTCYEVRFNNSPHSDTIRDLAIKHSKSIANLYPPKEPHD